MNGYAKEWVMSPVDKDLCGIINKCEHEIEKERSIVEIRKMEKRRNTELINRVAVFLHCEEEPNA